MRCTQRYILTQTLSTAVEADTGTLVDVEVIVFIV